MRNEDRTLARRLRRRRRWGGLVLRVENALAALAPVILLVLIFSALSLFGVWSQIPWWLHAAALIAGLGAFGWGLRRGWRGLERPGPARVDRRLEAAVGLQHQPIQAIADRPAVADDAAAMRLWTVHQERQRRALRRLSFIGLGPVFTKLDPWGLRAAAVLVLVVAVIDAGPNWRERLASAFVPTPAIAGPTTPARVDLWLTPPAYTGAAPVVRTAELPLEDDVEDLIVPAGSALVVQVHDPSARRLRDLPEPRFGLEALDVERLGPGSLEARAVMATSGALEIYADGDAEAEARFAIQVLPDDVPEIRFDGLPQATHRGVLNPHYSASDDYGVATIDLDLALTARPDARERLALRHLSRAQVEISEAAYVDLTPHPFAGQEVTARLVAVDVADQEGTSETITFVLPERVFNNIVAQAIIAVRKQLVAHPYEREGVAAQLNIMAQSPRVSRLEAAIALTLRAASTRLVLNEDGVADAEIVNLLWELALYLEEGQFAVAESDLRELERELQEALERGADEAELARLMDELERALDQFLEEMQRQALEQMRQMPPEQQMFQPLDPNAQFLDRQDFQNMLDAMRRAMESGATEQAAQMLAQLRELLENLQTAVQSPMMSPMQQNMGQLQELIQQQQQLLDQSFDLQQNQTGETGQQPGQPGQQGQQGQQQATPGQPGADGPPGSQGLGQQQEALRRALGDLMRQLGETGQPIPRALGQSELQMRGAEQALGQGEPGNAIGPQTDALDLLQQGAGQLMEQMQQQLGQTPGQPGEATGMGMPRDEVRDPLGRPLRNDGGGNSYRGNVPDQPDLGTARDVLQELRRRSGDGDRPAEELDYIDRLLRRF